MKEPKESKGSKAKKVEEGGIEVTSEAAVGSADLNSDNAVASAPPKKSKR